MSTNTFFPESDKDGMKRDLRWFNRVRAKNNLPPYTLRDLAKFQQRASDDIRKHGRVLFPDPKDGYEECV